MRIAIKGLGRIGRSLLRQLVNNHEIEIKLIYDLNPDVENICYMINYDSIYGNLDDKFKQINKNFIGNSSKEIKYLNKKNIDITDLNNIDVVVDSSGLNVNSKLINKLKSKIKNYIYTNYPKNQNCKYILNDINSKKSNFKNFFISSGTCDANAILPIIDLIDKKFGIVNGNISTLHPWLSYQNLLDGPSKSVSDPGNIFSTYVLGRSSINNIIPKTTSVVDVASKINSNIKSKFTSLSYRVPTNIVSSAEINMNLNKKIKKKDIINLLKNFENEQTINLIKVYNSPLTSLDFIKSPYSSNIDERWIETKNKSLRIVCWYDNEYGYTSRIVDLLNSINNYSF